MSTTFLESMLEQVSHSGAAALSTRPFEAPTTTAGTAAAAVGSRHQDHTVFGSSSNLPAEDDPKAACRTMSDSVMNYPSLASASHPHHHNTSTASTMAAAAAAQFYQQQAAAVLEQPNPSQQPLASAAAAAAAAVAAADTPRYPWMSITGKRISHPERLLLWAFSSSPPTIFLYQVSECVEA